MKVMVWFLTACACVASALVWPCAANGQDGIAAIIEEIDGTAFWRRNPGARRDQLDPRSDRFRRLYPGEQVRCGRGSRLVLRMGHGKVTVPHSRWFSIPPPARSKSDPNQKLLEHYANLGGRSRDGESRVYSPADHSVAMPAQFVIRWMPGAVGCKLSFVIQDVEDNKLWRADDIDAALGRLDAEDARKELADFRAGSETGPLTLKLSDSCGTASQVSFFLLSVKNEQLLRDDLDFWDKHMRTARHLGRASVFSGYGMLSQVAEEYEAALKLAPRSRDLLLRTIVAHRQTGNFVRRRELEKRLPFGAKVP